MNPPPLDAQAFAEVIGQYVEDIATAVAERHGENVADIAEAYAETLVDVARYCVAALDEMARGGFDVSGVAGDRDYFENDSDPTTAADSALSALLELAEKATATQ